jgi:hypothetical protein
VLESWRATSTPGAGPKGLGKGGRPGAADVLSGDHEDGGGGLEERLVGAGL